MHRLGLAIVMGIATMGAIAADGAKPVLVEGKATAKAVSPGLAMDVQAQQAIDAQVAAMAADWGIVVVMEPGTGKLLVLADSGAVNPAT